MQVDIRIENDTLTPALKRLAANAADLTPAMRAIAGVLKDNVAEAFATESSPDGKPWLPLSPKTLARRQRRGTWPGSILRETGDLAASISSSHGSAHAIAGTNKIYAATHQFGDSSRNIPQREFLGISAEGRQEVLEIVANWISPSA